MATIEWHILAIGTIYLKLGNHVYKINKNISLDHDKGQAFQCLIFIRLLFFMCIIPFMIQENLIID